MKRRSTLTKMKAIEMQEKGSEMKKRLVEWYLIDRKWKRPNKKMER